MKSAQAPSAPPSSGAGPVPAVVLGVSGGSRAQPALEHPCGCAEWMKIPWIPHGSWLPRAICSLARECPTSQTWLERGRARTGPDREAIPHLFPAVPALPSCLRSLLGLLHLPRSLPWSRAASGILNSCLPAQGAIRGLPLLTECLELPEEPVGSQITSPRHHRESWALGKVQSGKQTPQPTSQLMSHSKLLLHVFPWWNHHMGNVQGKKTRWEQIPHSQKLKFLILGAPGIITGAWNAPDFGSRRELTMFFRSSGLREGSCSSS